MAEPRFIADKWLVNEKLEAEIKKLNAEIEILKLQKTKLELEIERLRKE